MRQQIPAWLSGLLLSTLLATAVPAQAADVTITVNGRVVAKPCTVSTPTATVDLGDLLTANLRSAGSSSSWHDVTLNLTNCPVGTSSITAAFSGTADNTGYYKNLGTAGNIQLQLEDNAGTTLNNGSSKKVQVQESSSSASYLLRVRALTVNGGATQGSIQAVINVTYTYS